MINLFSNLSKEDNSIIDFILNSTKFNFKVCKEAELNNCKNTNSLYLVSPQTKTNELNKILSHLLKLKIENIFYLLPTSLKETHDKKILNKVFYPTDFFFFEKKINNFFSQKIILNEFLFLSNDNLLTNSKSNNKIYLTEIESKLITLLNEKKSISKNKINEIVLGHKTIIESKSLDTHLYRLRSKISQVSNKIKIEHDDNKNIKMIII